MYQAHDLVPIDFPPSFKQQPALNRKYLRWTHRQLQYASQVLASCLKAQGLKKGMAIATLMYNWVEWCMVIRAAAILGCPFVPLNPKVAVNLKEVEHMLKVSGAQALVIADLPTAQKLQDGLPNLINEMVLKAVLSKDRAAFPTEWAGFYDIISVQKIPDAEEAASHGANDEKDTAIIIFTSGTTSLPKGAAHSNKSFGSALQSLLLALEPDPDSRTCCHMPTYHIAGVNITLSFQLAGGSVVFPSASFDAGLSLDA
jgi:acyl-CoA synthetase (AMP-forming)/AMP-acid ligase II